MHKLLIVSLALFAVFAGVFGDSSEEILDGVKSKHLRTYLDQNRQHVRGVLDKLEEKCAGVTPKLKSALESFQQCANRTDESLTICSAIQTTTLNCTTPLIQVVDQCLPTGARGLPQLGIRSALSVADYLCKQTGETLFELANPCIWKDVNKDSEEGQEDECDLKVKAVGKKFEGGHITPSDVCTSVTSLRSCTQTQLAQDCKNQKTRDAVLGLFDALVAPCTNLNEV